MDNEFTEGDFNRLLARAFRMHAKRSHADLAPIGITHGQPRVLHYLSQRDGCIQRDLAEAFDLEPATVTDVLTVMEREGLVTKRNDPADRRILRVYITDKGRQKHDEVEAIFASIERECFAGFSERERSQTLRYLDRVYGNLKRADAGREP